MNKKISVSIIVFLCTTAFINISKSSAQTLAFPTAVGFGKDVTGGRGGTVYHVTNLNDSGTGSFRDAVSVSNRIIVFDVSGYITLLSAVSCKSNLTIAGQTAPGEGIGFKGGEISFAKSSNIICRYIRIRPGSETASSTDDALSIYRAKNIIMDHCSFSFAPWNNIDGVSDDYTNYPVTNITFQNCLISNPTGQQFGAHCESVNSNWTWAYNIFANSHNRNPLDKVNDIFINNVLYNCSAGFTTHTSTNFKHDIIGNYFIKGPASTGTDNQWYQVDKNQSIYYTGNLKDSNLDGILNGSATTPYWYQGAGTILSAPWSTLTNGIPTYSAATAYRYAASVAGTFPHDEMDRLAMSQIRKLGAGTTGTDANTCGPGGALYTSQTQTGLGNNGYGTIATGTRAADTDNDGIPDFWEKTFGSNVNSNDAMTVGSDGYALIEKYINWLGEVHSRTTQNTTVDLDMSTYAGGFATVSPIYTVSNATNGTVTLSGSTAHFTPTTNFSGMASYKFTIKGSDAAAYTFTVYIVVEPSGAPCTPPTATITAAGNTTFCQGNTVILNANTGTGLTYQWKNGATNISGATAASYTASASGSYAVIVTKTCSTTSSSVSITVMALPTATITAPATSFCTGSSVVLTASTGSSYKWFNGTAQVGTAATYTATAAGNYTVEVTNAAGCKATSSITAITVNPIPVITQYVKVDAGAWLTAATASACEGSTVNLGPQPNLAAGWAWTGPNNFTSALRDPVLTNVVVANAGNYIATYTDVNGCKASSTFALQVSKPAASITASATSFCTGGSVVLTASAGSSYEWFNGTAQVGTASTYTATASGSYTVEVTNASGCKATSAATQITVSAAPIATITAPATSFCTGGSVILSSSAGASYKWFNGTTQVGTAATYTATASGSYTVEVTNSAGCKAASAATQITVSAAPAATITSPATAFCTGGSVVLTASTGVSYKWFNGTNQVGTDASYTATAAGSYTVEVTNASGCKATSAATTITTNALPTATITSPATSFCTASSVVLTASTGSSYKWFNGTAQVGTAATYTATAAGSYTVEVTNAAGCKATSAVIQISLATTVTWYADADNDGLGDISNTINACTKPNGYVATAGDACPADANKTAAGNCGCGMTEASCLDCNGTPNGTAFLDNCSICVGGTTGNTACLSTATVNGTSANITVAPQPFDEATTITVENYGMIQSFTIISASGAIVETRHGLNTEEVILGEAIASGLYTVIITTEKGTYTTKIVKK